MFYLHWKLPEHVEGYFSFGVPSWTEDFYFQPRLQAVTNSLQPNHLPPKERLTHLCLGLASLPGTRSLRNQSPVWPGGLRPQQGAHHSLSRWIISFFRFFCFIYTQALECQLLCLFLKSWVYYSVSLSSS